MPLYYRKILPFPDFIIICPRILREYRIFREYYFPNTKETYISIYEYALTKF